MKEYNDYKSDRNRSRERTFMRNYSSSRDRCSSNSRSRSGSRAKTNRDRIRCYKCREYDHFVRDYPNSREARDLEQLQQGGFSAYSSPVMLISRKLTKDKKVVTDFRHLNVRIAKNSLAYPLVRETFSVLGNSKCEILSVLDLKDAFHSLRLSENSKRYCRILLYFGSSSYLYQRIPMGLNISPSI